MSEGSKCVVASAEHNKVGPNYFGFYVCEVAELLSQDKDFLPCSSQASELSARTGGQVRDGDKIKHGCDGKEAKSSSSSGSLFSNGIGAGISDFKNERLKALLRQSVTSLTQEVDEMLDPVLAIRQIQAHLRYKKHQSRNSNGESDGCAGQFPCKKRKMSSPNASHISCGSSREGSAFECVDGASSEKGKSNIVKSCAHCHTTETLRWRTGPEGHKSLCDACGIRLEKQREPLFCSNTGAEKENGEVNDDLKILLENDCSLVEERVKKYSDELSGTLGLMEQQLEELLDTVMCQCRPMTRREKQQLQKMIQKLPPKNLERAVEIIQRGKLPEIHSDEIHVNLEKEDNATLWRLYYYVEAVEKARKLSR